MKVLRTYILFTALSFCACIGKEQPVLDKKPELMQIAETATGPRHYYLNLQKRKVVASVSVYDWDLAFDCRENGFEILVNSAKGMGVHNTGTTFFEAEFPLLKYPFFYDNTENDLSKTAIGTWGDFSFSNPQSYGWVYIIHRGFDINFQPIGLKKLIINGSKDGLYAIRFSNLDNSEAAAFSVRKDPNAGFAYFSFENGGQLKTVEPAGEEWDLLITPYLDSTYYSNKSQFMVSDYLSVYDGILINPVNRWAALDTNHTFDEIDFRYFGFFSYTSEQNFIGCHFYKWNKDLAEFTTRKNRTYLVKDHGDYVYKLRFLDFERNANNAVSLSFEVKNL